MKNMTLGNIAAACGGIYHGTEAAKEKTIAEITTDSRKAGKDSLFVAIKGERVDAHKFIPAVFEQGALCVISEQELADPAGAYIQVDSSLQAIKDIAEFYRKQLDIKVVGITGSVGKTSTKEMIASVLSEKYRVLKTLGNFNNELGLPLTVFRLREEDEIAVLEMGISHFGEMHRLSKIARPDICVITNIGQCHLEFLGDRDGVLKAKSEIFDYLAPDGTIVLNGDDDKLATLQEVKGIQPVFFGIDSDRTISATQIHSLGLKTLLLSDNSAARIERFNRNIRTLFIAEAGKPDPAAYRRACTMLNLPPEQVICIGDQIFRDIRGANNAELDSILVDFIRLPGETHYGKKRVLEKVILWFYHRDPRRRGRLDGIGK